MDPGNFKPRSVLAQNLKALMAGKHGPRGQTALRKKSGVAQATIGRILREESAASIETVAQLAEAYGLEPWQLLVPGMNPGNPPVLQPVGPQEKALYERLRQLGSDLVQMEQARYSPTKR